jgi:hypothetical protein
MNQSPYFSLNWQDALKGFVVAAITAALGIIAQSIDAGHVLPTLAELKAAGIAGLGAGVAYLLKNLFTNSGGKLAKKE